METPISRLDSFSNTKKCIILLVVDFIYFICGAFLFITIEECSEEAIGKHSEHMRELELEYRAQCQKIVGDVMKVLDLNIIASNERTLESCVKNLLLLNDPIASAYDPLECSFGWKVFSKWFHFSGVAATTIGKVEI